MADLGNIGLLEVESAHKLSVPIPTKQPYNLTQKYFMTMLGSDVEDKKVEFFPTYILCTKIPYLISIPWYMSPGTNEYTFTCQLSQYAIDHGAGEKPKIFINGDEVAEGLAIVTEQDIVVTYENLSNLPVTINEVTLGYYNNWNYESTCKWLLDNIGGVLNSVINTVTSEAAAGGCNALNCSYPIGEERPIEYNLITLEASSATTIAFRIPADTVTSTVTDAQILLTLSPYGSNANGDIEDIFASLGASWFKMYIYDGATSLRIDVETWNSVDNFAKVWITIPTLTAAAKDIVLHHNALDSENPDSTMFSVIGF